MADGKSGPEAAPSVLHLCNLLSPNLYALDAWDVRAWETEGAEGRGTAGKLSCLLYEQAGGSVLSAVLSIEAVREPRRHLIGRASLAWYNESGEIARLDEVTQRRPCTGRPASWRTWRPGDGWSGRSVELIDYVTPTARGLRRLVRAEALAWYDRRAEELAAGLATRKLVRGREGGVGRGPHAGWPDW